jgi:hypothetical protein
MVSDVFNSFENYKTCGKGVLNLKGVVQFSLQLLVKTVLFQ